jgi:hypothetical protein
MHRVSSKTSLTSNLHPDTRLKRILQPLLAVCLLTAAFQPGHAQDRPYFITYSHDLEERGEMEVASRTAIATPNPGSPFGAMAAELEYGLVDWWTVELYVDGQATDEDSAILTGFRFENRIKPLKGEHVINPVLYVEYGNVSGADKTFLEVVGHDDQDDLSTPNSTARHTHQHEGEFRLILSSDVGPWNFSENFIFEKDLGHAPWEFGYSVGATRPLRAHSTRSCRFCIDKLVAGAETYGGLGDTSSLTLSDTSHYIAPLVGWLFSDRARVSFSPGFGLGQTSLNRVYRLEFAYEFEPFGRRSRGID